MRFLFERLALLLVVLLLPVVAMAQAASLPVDPAGIVGWFAETHKAHEWSLLIGGVLTLLVRVVTLLKPIADKLPAESTKWIAMGLAMLGSVATGLLAHVPWYQVVVNGVQVGVASIGGWELILKPLISKLAPKPQAAA